MNDRQLRGIISRYQGYIVQAEELKKESWGLDEKSTELQKDTYCGLIPEYHYTSSMKIITERLHNVTKSLVNSFNDSIKKDADSLKDMELYTIESKGLITSLNELIIECNVIIGSLKGEISGLSSNQLDKLGHLKNEISDVCKNLDINFEKNLNKSIELSEKGHFLGSALITSRVVDYILNKIKGENINQKIKTLIDSGAIKKDDDKTKEQIIKANKKSRNYLNHRIDTFAEPSDALSLLGDCVTLLKIFEKAQS
jgi:hypothetical protein